MFKKIVFGVFSSLLIFGSVTPVFAKTVYKAPVVAAPTPTPVATVNSFEMFWPLVAGKTIESKLYSLKLLKEKIRGFLIFGKAQKADYEIFLGIKRMLEAEVLMKANNSDLANKTLDKAIATFQSASANLDAAKASGDIPQNVKDEINTRVNNLKKFVGFLIAQNKNYKDKLQSVLDVLNQISSKI